MLSYDERQNSCRGQGPFYLGPDRPDRRLGPSSFNVTSEAANLFEILLPRWRREGVAMVVIIQIVEPRIEICDAEFFEG